MTLAEIKRRIAQLATRRASTAHIIVAACPFCGCTAQLQMFASIWSCQCDNGECLATGPLADTPEAAAKKWRIER